MNRIEVIRTVLEEGNRQKIKYCVLRNYDFLLENRTEVSPSERSVDMVIAQDSLAALEKVLIQCQFQPRKERYSRCHKAYFRLLGTEPVSFDVQVGGISWNDLIYLSEDALLARRVRRSFFYVPSVDDQFVMFVVHSLLGKRYFKEEYKKIISSLCSQINPLQVLKVFSQIFGPGRAQQLYDLTIRREFEVILAYKYHFILTFLLQSRKRLFPFLSYALRYQKWQSFRLYPLISIIGPDGAGKTTMATALQEYLHQHNRRAVIVYTGRGRGNILPMTRLGKRYKNQEKQRDRITPPQLGPRKLLYTLAFPVFTCDQLLRYLIHILPRRHRRTIVITDRYCSDLLLMKHVPLRFKRWLLSLFPQPTMTFYLYNTVEVLHSRRPQEAVEELQRQLTLFRELNSWLNLVEILTKDQKRDSEAVVAAVLTHVYREWY